MLHALRSKLSEQKTYRFVTDRQLDKLYRDSLDCECTLANLKVEKKELSSFKQQPMIHIKIGETVQ